MLTKMDAMENNLQLSKEKQGEYEYIIKENMKKISDLEDENRKNNEEIRRLMNVVA